MYVSNNFIAFNNFVFRYANLFADFTCFVDDSITNFNTCVFNVNL
jgi:hypothetical protein